MSFNPQQIYPIDLNPNKAVGVNIPLNGSSVFKSNYLTKDAIKNNLINFFLTNPGERFLNPSFGAGLRDFIFEQIAQDNLEGLKETINLQIQSVFPNISVNKLEILRDNNIANAILININYSIINTNIIDNLQIQF
jgi:phage baseplate assembly protein W